MATDLTVNGATFTFTENDVTVGESIDGVAYVIDGGSGVTLTGVTPTQTTDAGGYVYHGAMLNPKNRVDAGGAEQGQTQSFDERQENISGGTSGYNAALAPSYPQSLSLGDIVVKSIGRTSPAITWSDASTYRVGIFDAVVMLIVVSAAPTSDQIAPAAFGWTGRTTPTWITLTTDLDTIVASLPSYDLTGLDYCSLADALDYFDHFDPTFGRANGVNSEGPGSFETQAVYKWASGGGQSNYGRERGAAIGSSLLHLLGDVATDAQKKTLMRRAISNGVQWGEPWIAVNDPFGGNGGLFQFHYVPVALAIKYAGLNGGDMGGLHDYMPGNLAQLFVIDQNWLDTNYVYHVDSNKPASFYRHTIQSVSNLTITVDSPRGGIVIGGLKLRRESDGAFAYVENPANKVEVPTFDILAQPDPPFEVGDVVHFAFTREPVIGEVYWDVRTAGSTTIVRWFSPSNRANYVRIQCYSDDALLLKGLDCWHEDFDKIQTWVEQLAGGNWPATQNEHELTLEGAFGNIFLEDFYGAYWDTVMNPAAAAPRRMFGVTGGALYLNGQVVKAS